MFYGGIMKKSFILQIIGFSIISFIAFVISAYSKVNLNESNADNYVSVNANDPVINIYISPKNEKNLGIKPTTPPDNINSKITEEMIEVASSITADINGDGSSELAEVILKPYVEKDNGDSFILRDIKKAYIRITINNKNFEALLCDSQVYETQMFLLDLGDSNKKAVIVSLDVGGSGMGHKLLYAIHFNKDIEFLPLPPIYDVSVEELGGELWTSSNG